MSIIDVLRTVVVAESCFVFLAGVFLLAAYRRPDRPREVQAIVYALHVTAFGYALAIGTNGVTGAPVTPGLFIAFAVLTVATVLASAALWTGWRKSRR